MYPYITSFSVILALYIILFSLHSFFLPFWFFPFVSPLIHFFFPSSSLYSFFSSIFPLNPPFSVISIFAPRIRSYMIYFLPSSSLYSFNLSSFPSFLLSFPRFFFYLRFIPPFLPSSSLFYSSLSSLLSFTHISLIFPFFSLYTLLPSNFSSFLLLFSLQIPFFLRFPAFYLRRGKRSSGAMRVVDSRDA